MDLFSYIAYFSYINILWVLFTLLGLGVFGIAPATSSVIRLMREFREEQRYGNLSKFWNYYKESFFKTNIYSLIFIAVWGLLLLNVRITIVLLNSSTILPALYITFGILLLFISTNMFLNLTRNILISFKENIVLSVFSTFRFLHINIMIFLTLLVFGRLMMEKTALIILIGITLSCFFTDFFHSKMIEKIKQIKVQE